MVNFGFPQNYIKNFTPASIFENLFLNNLILSINNWYNLSIMLLFIQKK